MDRSPGALEEPADGTRQQERHYQLLSALQSLVKELPSSFQQRLSYTTLSDLALALLDGTVFEIVQGLLEIQHLTEKSLYNQRLRLQNDHRVLRQALRQKHEEAQQTCRPHNLPVLQAAQQRELEVRGGWRPGSPQVHGSFLWGQHSGLHGGTGWSPLCGFPNPFHLLPKALFLGPGALPRAGIEVGHHVAGPTLSHAHPRSKENGGDRAAHLHFYLPLIGKPGSCYWGLARIGPGVDGGRGGGSRQVAPRDV
ncbi:protein DGCR6L isoform X1 [Echinops telfairi]|uniref:Protein DGCR6L isoform X1 n=1 Tax=Echinops telfairi TaxID=9371 RepID=A0AC55D6U8_ECHTE|nr:protein DGCR6L isoform X1 [Echinops telfairi]